MRIKPPDNAVKQLDDLAGRFNAGETAADDNQREQPFSLGIIGNRIRQFQQPDEAIAQNTRIFERFQREDAFGDAGQTKRRGRRTD